MADAVGFIGLGNMGGPMARNLCAAGHAIIAFDAAGTEARAPRSARSANDCAEVARAAPITVLSLPSSDAVRAVVAEIAASGAPPGGIVVDTSTIGPAAARAAHAVLAPAGLEYVDAPISGQAFRAAEGTLTFMVAGSDDAFARIEPALSAMGSNVFHVGRDAGQGQTLKLVNNYLSISSFVTTSEAVACGVRNGLDMQTILDVVNVSTGQNFTTTHVFPRNVVPGTFDMNAAAAILTKDLGLYVEEARRSGASTALAGAALAIIEEFVAENPDADQSEIYRFVLKAGAP